MIFDREYVVRRGLRNDFVVVVGDWEELLYEFAESYFQSFLDVSEEKPWSEGEVLKCVEVLK